MARANGEAEAKLRIADADRQAAILNAEGKAEAIRLEGESRAKVLRLNAEILHDNPLVVDLAKADRWNGATSKGRFARDTDSLLEGDGFEPSVPGDKPRVPSWKMLRLLQMPAGRLSHRPTLRGC